MPQMAPLLWFNLMIMFLFSFMVFFCITYFIKLPLKIEKPTISLKMVEKKWSW